MALSAVLLSPLFGAPVGAAPALGDAIADKRAEAQRVARELEAQGERVSILAEQLNQARMKADHLAERVRAAESELAAAEHQVGAVRGRLRDRAVASYVGSGRDDTELPIDQLLESGSANDLVVRSVYVATVAGREQATVDMLDAAQEQRRVQRAQLDEAERSAKGLLDEVAAQRSAAADAAAARRATLAQVQGELGVLVQAEQARRAAEAVKRAQAELAARQAEEEAARASSAAAAAAAAARQREEAARRAATPATALPVTIPRLAGDGDQPADPPAGTAAPARPVAPGASAAVAEARRQLGKPYEYGSPGPDSFDCSGLTSYAWRAGGRSLPHSSAAQYGATSRVPLSQIEVGDLVFYGSPIHHVGIYAGEGQMVEASETGTPIRMSTIFRRDMVGVGRVG